MERRNYAEWKDKMSLGKYDREPVYEALTGEWQTRKQIAQKIGRSENGITPALNYLAQNQFNVQRMERIGKPALYRKIGGGI